MILDKIVEAKLKRINSKKISFYDFLKKDGLSIIGEIKRASPSKKNINMNIDIKKITMAYNNSVDAISVLTEEDFFKGSIEFLKIVKSNSKIPVLRKDFIIDKRQIYESSLVGADAILLIVSILSKSKLSKFIKVAYNLNMDALVEVHNEEELTIAIEANAKIIGINNRNLKTFKVNLNNTVNLRKLIPKDILVISESGITSREDIEKIGNIDAILVGESFMKSKDIEGFAKELKYG